MKKRLLASIALSLTISIGAYADSPKREFRSSWVAGMNIDWPYNSASKGTSATAQANAKKELTDYLDNFKNQNFTGICLHVRPNADAYYKSSYEPWSADLTGTRGQDPGWDPLAFAVEECHKRGLECYAWINPFRITGKGYTYTTAFDNQWVAKGWVLTSGNWKIFNPALPEARRHCLDVIKEIYTNYAIDGMLFDDYFYPGDGMVDTSDAGDYQQWVSSGTKLSIANWRRDNVNTFVKELYNEIQASRPDLRFGIGPAGVAGASAANYGLSKPNITSSDWMYDKIYCDPLAWLNDGTIDFVSPQIYWGTTHSTAPFGPLCKWWSDVANHFGRHLYVSAASYRLAETSNEYGGNNTTGWGEIVKEVELTRTNTQNDAPGIIYYNTKTINGPQVTGLGEYLAQKAYTAPSLIPVADWKEHPTYDAPKGLAQSGSTLSWSAVSGANANSIIRYTVYAVPSGKTLEEAQAGNGDGIDGEYLLGVSYANSYSLPTAKSTGYWYAVCVYDGYGYESQPAMLGYSTEPSVATTLISPEDGAQAQWQQSFSWQTVEQASYRFQLAKDNLFTQIVADEARLSTTSTSVNFDNIAGDKFFWRVTTTQSGKLPTPTEVRSLLAPQRTPAPKPVVTLPTAGTVIEDAEMTIRWTCNDNSTVNGFRVEIATVDGSFTNPIYTKSLTAASEVSITASSLGKGDYQCRVVAYGSHLTETASDPVAFSVGDIPISEVGYSVKTDGSTYSPIGTLKLESLWMRAVKTGWENITFDNNGVNNRGLAANDKGIYICGRSDNSTSATLYLNVYDPENGQFLQKLVLSGHTPYQYGCNDLVKDTKGNICTYNLSLSNTQSANRSIYIYNIDLQTGKLTQVALVKPGTLGRIDHLGLLGDVTTGNFTIMAVTSSSNKIAVWKVTNGVVGTVSSKTVSGYYPSTSSNFGIAPRIVPETETSAYVDGGGTMWTLYDLSATRPTIAGSFNDNTAIKPTTSLDNGGAVFTLNNNKFMVYNHNSSGTGCKFQLVYRPISSTATGFADYKQMWIFPDKNLGTIESGTSSAPVDVVVYPDNTARIYVYSPGNGLAAYTLTDSAPNSATDINTPAQNFVVEGLTVTVPTPAQSITAYTTTGALVLAATVTNTITLPTAGVYLINIDGKTVKVNAK